MMVEEVFVIPASFAQQRLWFLNQLEPDNRFYNIAAALRIEGLFDAEVLARSLNEVARRHEVLRTGFAFVDGEPVQIISPTAELALPILDLQSLAAPEREQRVRALAAEEARYPFDLEQGPLLRASVLRLGAQEHILLLTLHHIIADAWSVSVLVRELSLLYDAFARGAASPLAELPIQYADFAIWQRQHLTGAALERQLDYWRRRLAGAPPLLQLPTDRTRASIQPVRGAQQMVLLPASLTAALKKLSQREGVTLFMTLFAAFNVLLKRYSGQSDILIGTPVSGRTLKETGGLIGFFVNTLALRTDLAGDPTFSELLRRVRGASVEDYEHQELPFEKLVEELQPERTLSYTPVFQVMFALNNAPHEEFRLAGLKLSLLDTELDTAKYDLTLTLGERGDALKGAMKYNAALFDAETIGRMLAHWQRLLTGIVAHPEARISQLPLLDADEKQQLLYEWNATAVEYEPEVCVHHLFARQAARAPDALALVCDGQQLTYAALDARANQLAQHLRRLGLKPEQRVGVLLERGIAAVVALLAILKAGGAYLPLDPSYPAERLAFMLEDAGAAVLVTRSELVELAGGYAGAVVCVDRDAGQLGEESAAELEAEMGQAVMSEQLAYVIYTSGSTGRPNGVMVTHAALANHLAWRQQAYPLTAGDRFLHKASISFDIAVWEELMPLVAGARLVVAAPGGQQDAGYLAALMASEEVSVAHFGPAMLQVFVEEEGVERCLSLREVYSGGEALRAELAQRVKERLPWVRVHQQYGPTEATIDATIWDYEEGASESGRLPIGRAIGNTRVYVLDESGAPVPQGVAGELYIGGAGLARGYQGRAELTAERFVPDEYGGAAGGRLYRTGDVVRWRGDGQLEFIGRADHQVKVRGYRIELGEIEVVLQQHPAVADAVVVVAGWNGASAETLAAYVVLRPAADVFTSVEAREYLRARLPEHMTPQFFVILEALPLTANGKIDKAALPPPDRDVALDDEAMNTPRNEIEELLAGMWERLLKVAPVGVHSNFFELGGHSLLATQVISRVRAAFGIELPLRSIFEEPTIAGLARRIETAQREGSLATSLPLVPVARAEQMPLSFAQQRLWFLDQLQPGSSFYNLPAAARLNGELDVQALAQSLNEVVRRHEVLRSSFVSVEGRATQRIAPALQAPLPVTDLSAMPEDERSAEALRLLSEEAHRPFDLAQAPLLRVRLLRLSEQSHVLLLAAHHIIADGWSIGIFVRELAACYEAFAAQQPSPLAALNVQYADYAVWQQRAQETSLEAGLAYWQRTLAGAPATLALPMDRARPPVQTFNGNLFHCVLPTSLTQSLKELSKREDVTLFMTLVAGFNALLARYTGQDDLVVGVPVAGRSHPETESMIGFFVNMLALRVDVGGDPTGRELLRRVRAVCLGAYAHQEVPFERVVEALGVERSLSQSPVFQALFAFNNTPHEALRLQGLEVVLEHMHGATARYDLTFSLEENAHGLRMLVEYNTDLFDETTVRRLAHHYERALAGLVADVGQRVSELPLLDADETEQMLCRWNETAVEYEREVCVHHLFARQAARTPELTALIEGEQQLSYAALDARSNQLAHYLRRLGVKPEQRVGVLLERGIAAVVALLAILKAGGAYLPLDPSYPAERLAFMLEDAGAAVLVTRSELVELAGGYAGAVVCVDRDAEQVAQKSAAELEAEMGLAVMAEQLAYVIYTSGSTGKPKGVSVCHRNVVNFFAGMDERVGDEQPGVWLAVTSLSFDISVLELFWTLTRGYTVVLQGEVQEFFAPARAADDELAAQPIDFSLFYFASDEAAGDAGLYSLLLEGAKFADRHGFAAVWTPERHFHAFGGLYPNPAVTSAAIAAVTERVQIRAGSVVIPLHDPLCVAEEWAVVDNLSGGRVAISFASGWHANDFVLAPELYQQRHEVMYRNIETVRKLWRGEAITRRSGAGSDIEVKIHPRPVQAELPIWITAAGSPDTFKTAGRMGAGLLTHLLGQTVEELAEKIEVYRAAWREAGHAGAGHVTLMLHTFVSTDLEEVRAKVREPFKNYLRTSINLLRASARSLGRDLDAKDLSEEDMQAILNHAFSRYFETSALLGTPETCLLMIKRLKAVGVDEVGCLIDFGINADEALANLCHLNVLRERSNPTVDAPRAGGYSVAEQIVRHQVTHMQCTPSMARLLSSDEASLTALRGLKKLLVGGEACPVALARQLRTALPAALYNMYGPTETTIWSTVSEVVEVEGSVPVGTPIANTTIRILDRNLRPAPIGVKGELYIGGSGVARGYHDRPELTAASFLPDPFAQEPGERMYRTGDFARYLPDGRIDLLGRSDQQVKVRGHRIETGEIETALGQHPGVREAVVVARADETGEHRLVAYVVTAGAMTRADWPQRLTGAEAERVIAGRPHFKLPNGMVIVHLSGNRASVVYHEIFENELYLRHGITLKDGDCVFDVGANVGMFTLFAARGRERLDVYAFEPIPPTFDVLRANLALYGVNAKLFNTGIAARRESAAFTFYPQMPGLSGRYSSADQDKQITKSIITGYLQTQGAEWQKAILTDAEIDGLMEEQFKSESYTCPVMTLSEVIREHRVERIDLLKIDVEKSEFDVLAGLDAEDWPKVRQIVAEVDTPQLLAQITPLLEQHGFTFVVDELVNVAEGVAGMEVHVYMLYARRPGETAVETVAAPARDTSIATAGELRAFLQERLPPYMIPASFTFLEALPHTSNGKIDRRALPAPTPGAAGADEDYVAPETTAEQLIAEVWCDVLKLERVGVNANFFEVGGTSLLIVQVNSKLRERFKKDIPVVQMFRHPTISALARHLDSAALDMPTFERAQARAGKQAEAQQSQRARLKQARPALKRRPTKKD
jgi:natural product biosynthesis luciferase-like monooxygenase protein/amino acid adenylation domain-containing protein/FkbM family methyltransferase